MQGCAAAGVSCAAGSATHAAHMWKGGTMTTVDGVEAQMRLHDLLDRVQHGDDAAGLPVASPEPSAAVTGQHVAAAASVLGTHWRNHTLGCHLWAHD